MLPWLFPLKKSHNEKNGKLMNVWSLVISFQFSFYWKLLCIVFFPIFWTQIWTEIEGEAELKREENSSQQPCRKKIRIFDLKFFCHHYFKNKELSGGGCLIEILVFTSLRILKFISPLIINFIPSTTTKHFPEKQSNWCFPSPNNNVI